MRTYLSWKDVRKHAKDSHGDGGPGVEVDALEEGSLTRHVVADANVEYLDRGKADRQGAKDHNKIALGNHNHIF